MKKRTTLVVFLIVFSTMLSSFAFYFYQVIYAPNFLIDQEDRFYYIGSNYTFDSVQNSLYDQKIVNDLVAFSFLAKLMDYDKAVKHGRYRITQNMSNLEAIRMLRGGEQVPTTISFSSARKLTDLSEDITTTIQISKAEFDSIITDTTVMKHFGFTPETFISMFIPNTYEVYWTITSDQLLKRLKKEYDIFWDSTRIKKAEVIGMNPQEVSTLASIVQAETAKNDEKPIVAGLYINRLRKGIPLQADPTLIYAANDFTIRRVLNRHKKIDSPYNTYKYSGLPPGPIKMPSISSLDAVLNYKNHDYLYFCAKEDFSGYHNFATNYSQHLKNARKYQRALNKRKVFR